MSVEGSLVVGLEALTDFSDGCYLAYPHTNGFMQDGRLVVGRVRPGFVDLEVLDPHTRNLVPLKSFPEEELQESEKFLWFDVALDDDRVAVCAGNWVYCLNPSKTGLGVVKYRHRNQFPPPGGQLPSIRRDGLSILFECRESRRYRMNRLDLDSDQVRCVVEFEWLANHFQYSPFDPGWIGVAHEGATETVNDRVWAVHSGEAALGKCLFDQTGSGLYLGHERWCFDRLSCLVVAYGESPGGPRGVYECFPRSGEMHLVSEGDRDWHVNVSVDGRWVVVDTTGPSDRAGRGWQDAGQVSDILVICRRSGERRFLARVGRAKCHPRHPHPAFSRDGSWIYFNDADPIGKGNRVCRMRNPFTF